MEREGGTGGVPLPREAVTVPPAPASRWAEARRSLAEPFVFNLPMVVLVLMVPLYILIPELLFYGRVIHTPALAWDGRVPLVPGWSLVYGTFYLFLIVLPVFIVRRRDLLHRTFLAYLAVWGAAYVCFVLYPTVLPRPEEVPGNGFGAWGLRLLYSHDAPYNCFPSLHVAHSFLSALACRRVHRGVGLAALLCAALVGLSTLFTRQHYLLDVAAGILLAVAADALFLRKRRGDAVPGPEHRAAPVLALGVALFVLAGMGCFWLVWLAESAG